MSSDRARNNVQWVEGVRGVASFIVVITHLCRAWSYNLWYPRDNETAAPNVLQLPFLRLPWQGRIGVTMFAFLTGYVCALKPLRQVKSGNLNAALNTLGKSAFRRPPRLIMPATIAMLIAWTIAQMGGFDIAVKCDSNWLRRSSVKDIGSLDTEIPRLLQSFQSVWTNGFMAYDEHQWALLPLLKGAFLIYVTLFATIFMKFRMRLFTCVVLWSWYWWCNHPKKETFECQFLWGVILCDIGSEKGFRDFVNSYPRARRAVQTLCIIVGIYVAGYPGERGDWATWSQQLTNIGDWIFPPGTKNYPDRWSAVGWDITVIGIWLSPTLQSVFSNRIFSWIGRNSFAVYLTHGTLLRVVLVRFIYGWTTEGFSMEEVKDKDPIFHYIPRTTNWFVWATAIPVWFVMLYTGAHLWTTYVDSWCAKATKWLEDRMFESEDEKHPAAQYA